MPFFSVSFSPIFSRMGVLKEDNFSKAGCLNMPKGEILLDRVVLKSSFLYFGVYFRPIFSRMGYRLKVRTLEPGKTIFSWAYSHTNLGQVLPPEADPVVLTHCVSVLLLANQCWGSRCHARNCIFSHSKQSS